MIGSLSLRGILGRGSYIPVPPPPHSSGYSDVTYMKNVDKQSDKSNTRVYRVILDKAVLREFVHTTFKYTAQCMKQVACRYKRHCLTQRLPWGGRISIPNSGYTPKRAAVACLHCRLSQRSQTDKQQMGQEVCSYNRRVRR